MSTDPSLMEAIKAAYSVNGLIMGIVDTGLSMWTGKIIKRWIPIPAMLSGYQVPTVVAFPGVRAVRRRFFTLEGE